MVEFSIETLVEKTKPLLTEEYEFEYREKSILVTIFGFFGPSELLHREQIGLFFKVTAHHKLKYLNQGLCRRNQACSFGEI